MPRSREFASLRYRLWCMVRVRLLRMQGLHAILKRSPFHDVEADINWSCIYLERAEKALLDPEWPSQKRVKNQQLRKEAI